MAESVASVIADVRGTYPDAAPDIILDLANAIHRELCTEFPVETSMVSIDLTQGVGEYAIPQTVAWVRGARYVASPTVSSTLRPVSAAEMDHAKPGWRWDTPGGEPNSFYVELGKLGLYPAPSSSTVSGYPKVELVCAMCTPLEFDGDLPDGVVTRAPWVNGTRMLYAQMYDKDRAQAFATLYQMSIQQMERLVGRRNRYHKRLPYPVGYHGVRPI